MSNRLNGADGIDLIVLRLQRGFAKLGAWKSVLARWQLGPSANEAALAALRDHREQSLILRAEMNALVQVLLARGVISSGEWTRSLDAALRALDARYEQRFPGLRTTDAGAVVEADAEAVTRTMAGWPA